MKERSPVPSKNGEQIYHAQNQWLMHFDVKVSGTGEMTMEYQGDFHICQKKRREKNTPGC